MVMKTRHWERYLAPHPRRCTPVAFGNDPDRNQIAGVLAREICQRRRRRLDSATLPADLRQRPTAVDHGTFFPPCRAEHAAREGGRAKDPSYGRTDSLPSSPHPRDTGAKHFFEVPLQRAFEIYKTALSSVAGTARTVQGPSMSASPGKIQVVGIAEVPSSTPGAGATHPAHEKVFVLRFLQARNPSWCRETMFARFDAKVSWFDELEPAFGAKGWFFEGEYDRFRQQSGKLGSSGQQYPLDVKMRANLSMQSARLKEDGEGGEEGASNDAGTSHEGLGSSVGLGGRSTGSSASGDVDVVEAGVGAPDVLLTKRGQVGLRESSKGLRGVEAALDQHGLTSCADDLDIVGSVEGRVAGEREGARCNTSDVGLGNVSLGNVGVRVAEGVGKDGEHVGHGLVDVAAAERLEVPVGLDRGDGRVVGHVGVVGGVLEVGGHSTTEGDGEDAVGSRVAIVFIESEEDEGPVGVEVGVVEQSGQEVAGEVGEEGGGGVVTVVDHIGRDEGPLRERGCVDVDGEVVEVAVVERTGLVAGDVVHDGARVVLADVVGVVGGARGDVVLGGVVESGEAVVGHVLLVAGVGDGLACLAAVVEEVEEGGDVGGDVVEGVVGEAPEITGDRGDVVGLRRVGDGVVVVKENALREESLHGGGGDSGLVVGVLEPDLDDAVEGLAGDDLVLG
ncbi:hypothetical protein L1887_54381 [Cichorium endivia]|nr:hypothetical protein L1887_54381 [Cichorium endivia]